MFRGCENVNSGIDKGAPKKQLNNLQIANAFGTTKEEIISKKKGFVDTKRYDETRIVFLMNLWEKLCYLGKVNVDVYEMRKYILEEVEKWYSHLLSDSRFPVNDVTLWDQAYMTASMFKVSIAAMCLEGEKYKQYMEKPRSIKWSILGVQYDKLGLAEKALNPSFIDWYRKETDKVDVAVKKVIEEEFSLGNEIYRDETGIYFIVPENICGERDEDSIGLYRLSKNLKEIQKQIIECFKLLNGEVFPAIFLTKPSRGTMNIAYLLKNAKENFLKPVYPKGDFIEEYFGEINKDTKFRVVCDVCKVRLADKNVDEDLNLCGICKEREKENERTKLNDICKETIWTGEIQDKNGRLALVTMKFELDEWLNGNMLNTMLNIDTEYVSKNNWKKVLKDVEELLVRIKETYFISEGEFDVEKSYRLKKYKEFVEAENDNGGNEENKETKTLIDDFLVYFDERGVIAPYNNVIKYFSSTPPKEKKIDIYHTFDSYFYLFLEDIKLNKFNDIFVDDIERDDKYEFDTIKHRFKGKGKKPNNKTKKDWGKNPHITAKGMFSFAYVTEQIKSIILERSIGDEWERFLKDKLGEDKINFQNRKIEWDKLKDDDIKFLAIIITQFITRKNPSPARFRRIWETTEKFFIDIEDHMMDILEIPKWRNARIKWNHVIKKDGYKDREFEHKGLNFISDEKGNLYLISSIEKAIPILSKESIESDEKLQEIYTQIESDKKDWIVKKDIKMTDVSDNSEYKIQLKNPIYISYKPYLSIINPTPISWQFIVPAEYVPNFIEKVQYKYDEEFRYVKGKLPLHIGVVFQDYKKPLYIGIKALRNIRRDIDNWDSIEKKISEKELKQMSDDAINSGNSGCENRTELKRYYSLYPLKDKNKGDYSFYVRPNNDPIGLKSVDIAEKEEKYIIYPNTIDFEYLDVNTRRNDIYYGVKNDKEYLKENKEKAKRIGEYKQNRPYTWREWETFNKFRIYFKDKKSRTKLQTMTSLIYSKLDDWEDYGSLKRFMLSAFINTFDLRDDVAKNNFAQIFGKYKWNNLRDMDDELFRKELYKFLDMYDFWHNGLKEI